MQRACEPFIRSAASSVGGWVWKTCNVAWAAADDGGGGYYSWVLTHWLAHLWLVWLPVFEVRLATSAMMDEHRRRAGPSLMCTSFDNVSFVVAQFIFQPARSPHFRARIDSLCAFVFGFYLAGDGWRDFPDSRRVHRIFSRSLRIMQPFANARTHRHTNSHLALSHYRIIARQTWLGFF